MLRPRFAPLALVVLVPLSFAQSPGIVRRFDGDRPGAQMGFSVAYLGDVNGDGYADVLGGACTDGNPTPATGAVRVWSGRDATRIWVRYGDATGDRFGWSVAGIGDVDQDGVPDVLVGAPQSDVNGVDSGYARILGGADGHTIRTFVGEDAGDMFGFCVKALGDITGDGVPDVAIGAWQDEAGGASAGAVFVYSGADGALVQRLNGHAPGERFGWSTHGLGDVDHDGVPDFVVGASGARRAEVYSGATFAVIRTWYGSEPLDAFGFTVDDAGDVDGDGTDDVIVGAMKAFSNRGYARVFSGASGAQLFQLEGDVPEDWFSVAVCGVGDLDGDGRGDLAASGFKNDTNGHESGQVRVYSGRNGGVLATYVGDSGGDWFGYALAPAGDVDLDGVPDFSVGANQDDHNGFHSGSVTIVSGARFASVAPFCAGDGSGTPCPCGNDAPAGSGRGCASSVSDGGVLAGSGVASVSHDSIALHVSSLPDAAAVLLFQGAHDVAGGAGATFGDGLRCIGGSTLRLATQSCLRGHAQFPPFSGAPLSQAGLVPPVGATVLYQAWYRNSAGPCGTAQNLTNAVRVNWVP